MHMFVKSRLVAIFTLAASTSAFAVTPSLFGSCDSDGECSAIFNRSLPEVKALCGERTASVAWVKDSRPLLLQCVSSATDQEDNVNYLINGRDVVGLNYGRYVKISFLQQNPATSVPDKFGSVPVCTPANVEKLHTSAFVLLDKRPGESGTSDCYDVTYLSTSGDGVRLDTNAGTVRATDRAHFSGRVSNRTRQRVERLIQLFQTWRDQQPN
jgi:hypothetical protein